MEAVRDLGRSEPWQDSLERSLARRAAPRRAHVRPKRKPKRTNRRRLVLGGGVTTALALSLSVPTALGGGGNAASSTAARARTLPVSAHRAYAGAGPTEPASRTLVSRTLADGPPGACQPVGWLSGYANPLARAHVTPERIDQGVDYAGAGTLAAIGTARVTQVGLTGPGGRERSSRTACSTDRTPVALSTTPRA